MLTQGQAPRNVMPYEDSNGINLSFNAAGAIPKGCPIKLNGSGDATPATAVGDVVIGIATVPTKEAGERVTAITPFRAVVKGTASGAVSAGARVEIAGAPADGLVPYKTAVGATAPAANFYNGIAITSGSSTTEITVGLI